MLALKNLKSTFRLLFLTVFTTYSILYTLNYVNTLQPRQSVPRPSPYMIHYRGTPEDNTDFVEVTTDEVENVNTGNITSGNIHDPTKGDVLISLPSKVEFIAPVDVATSFPTSNDVDNFQLSTRESQKSAESQEYSFSDGYASIDTSPKTEDSSEFEDYNRKSLWPITLPFTNASALRRINYDKYKKHDKEFLKSRLNILEERAKLVGNVCKKQPSYLHKPSGANHLVWDTKHSPSIVWCPNYKVASTSMMMSFLRISSKSKQLQKKKKFVKQSDVRRIYWPPKTGREKAKVMRQSIRTIIVRHPFTRILSAYRDKMTKMKPGPPEFHYRKLQKMIIAKYRPSNSTVRSTFPTFPEFINYVIDETQSLASTEDWKKVKCWTTYWAHCNVCTTDYNVIMKLETLDDDKRFLVTLSDLEELKEKSPEDWLHLRNATSRDVAPKYYSQLTRDQMLRLYNIYKLDFELFNYNITDYLSLV